MRRFGDALRCTLFGTVGLIALDCGGAWAQLLPNFVQIRGFYPFENGNFSSAPALDASLRIPLGGTDSFGVKLQALTLLRQRGQVDLRFRQVFAGLDFRNEPGDDGIARSLGLAGLLLYSAPEPISFLDDVSLGYSLESEGGSGGYELHAGEAKLSGDLTERWTWSAEYALSSDLNPIRSRTTHAADVWVRTTLLGPVALGVGLGLCARDGRAIYQGSLEAALNLSTHDTLGLRLTLTTAPGDEERLFYDTTRLEPLSIGVYLGRGSESALIWGGNLAADTGFGVQLQADYAGSAFGSSHHEFSLAVRYGGTAGSLSLRGGMNLEYDPQSGLWFGRLLGQLTANLTFENFSFNAAARLDYGVDRLVGTLNGNATFFSFPWLAILEANLKYRDGLTGEASLQGLYFFTPNVALNLTGAYLWRADPTKGGFRFGIGARYSF